MNPVTPKALSLWSDEGDHAGFMLMAIPPGQGGGDCVFMLSPVSTEGIDSPLGMVVSELKALGEHPFEIEQNDTGFRLTVRPEGLPELVFTLDEEFSGPITTLYGEETKCIGKAARR